MGSPFVRGEMFFLSLCKSSVAFPLVPTITHVLSKEEKNPAWWWWWCVCLLPVIHHENHDGIPFISLASSSLKGERKQTVLTDDDQVKQTHPEWWYYKLLLLLLFPFPSLFAGPANGCMYKLVGQEPLFLMTSMFEDVSSFNPSSLLPLVAALYCYVV